MKYTTTCKCCGHRVTAYTMKLNAAWSGKKPPAAASRAAIIK